MVKYGSGNGLTVVLTRNLLARAEKNYEKHKISHGNTFVRTEHLTHTSLMIEALILHKSAQFNGLYLCLYF